MQIDRAKFLSLTAAIAAGACSGAHQGPGPAPAETVIILQSPGQAVAPPIDSGGHVADLDKPPPDDGDDPPEGYLGPSDEDGDAEGMYAGPAALPVPSIPSTMPKASATCNNLLGTPGNCSTR